MYDTVRRYVNCTHIQQLTQLFLYVFVIFTQLYLYVFVAQMTRMIITLNTYTEVPFYLIIRKSVLSNIVM